MAQLGSALEWGSRGRRFNSCHSDQVETERLLCFDFLFCCVVIDLKGTEIRDFTQGNITKQLFSFALPILLSNLLQVVYNMADMVIVGQVLGKAGTSAVAVGGDISMLLTFIAIGFANAGQVLIARYIGAGKQDQIGKFVGTMCGFLFFASFVISGLGLVFQNKLLALMNTPQAAYLGATQYSAICMIGLVFVYGYNVVSSILRGMGDSKHPFFFIAVAAILNIILDIIFVVFLDFGAGGAALATVISQGVSFISCTIFLVRKHEAFHLFVRLKDFFVWNRAMLSSLLKLGIPMAIKNASIQVSKLFVNSWVNSYGVEVSAFAGIANKLASVANMISMAVNTAGSTMVGQNLASKEYQRVKKILLNITVIMLCMASVLSIIIVLFPNQVFGLFTSDVTVLALVGRYIPIAILLFFGAAARSIMNPLLNGSGNYRINFVTAVFDGIILRIGLAVLFGFVLGWRHYGFWLGDALAGFTPFWIGVVFYCTGRWKKENA